MGDFSAYIEHLSPLKRALLALERMQAKLERFEPSKKELNRQDQSTVGIAGISANSTIASENRSQDMIEWEAARLEAIKGLAETDVEAQLVARLTTLEIQHDLHIEHLSPLKRTLLTLERMQDRLEQYGFIDNHRSHLPPLRPEERGSELPLSFAQQRLWFLHQLNPSKATYNEYAAQRIRGSLQVSVLERCINEIRQRHESLHTRFPLIDGRAVQYIEPWQPLRINSINLQPLPAAMREDQAIRLAEEEVKQPLDLLSGPLFKVTLFQLAEDDHLLLIIFHHSVGDGWSMGVFYRELATLYSAYCRGESSPLALLSIQYADFAIWQQQTLHGKVLEDQMAYWMKQLEGATTVLELPVEHSRPAMPTNRGSHLSFTLPNSLTQSLRELSQREEVTLFMTLLAAFQVLLYRYTGQDDILVGTTMANRTSAELEALIGFFANTLVLRGNMTGKPSFREFLQRVRAVALGAYAHQDVPFEQLVAALDVQRDLSRSPLFQVMFVLQKASWLDIQLPGLDVETLEIERERATFDLVLSIVDDSHCLRGTLEYSTDLFEEATIVRLIGQLQELLGSIVSDPEQSIDALPLLTAVERHQQLVEWNRTEREYTNSICIHDFVEAQAEVSPDAVALVYNDVQVTYKQLNQRANQLAHYLIDLGVGPDMLVGLCIERSIEMIIGILGVLKAGAAYIPLDPSYPPERLAFILKDAGTPILLTLQHLRRHIATTQAQVVCLDADWDTITQQSLNNPGVVIDDRNLAYAIYTSGSTGKPKGVLIEHAGLCSLVRDQIRNLELGTGSRVLQFVSFSFDVSVTDIFMALCSGATLHLVPLETMVPGSELLALLRDQAITVARIPPSALAIMPTETGLALKVLISGGESWSSDIITRWGAARRFLNEYGPTETTICATVAECLSDDQHSTIGRPLANVRVYVLDRELAPVPIGVPGELYIGGSGVARGYLHRAETTAECFLPDPFSALPGARFYRTGDLVCYLPDGSLKFLGRIDQQVKVRGFRIELGEIEAVLAQYPSLYESIVDVRADHSSDKRLVAYVVPKDPSTFSIADLRSFLQAQLPGYMVPSTFLSLEALPLGPNGKVDRKSLPIPENTRPELKEEYVAPQTPIEQSISEVWLEVLKLEQVGLQDNFFELGGHSLSMVLVHRKLQDLLKPDLTLVDLFKYPTVKALANFLSMELGEHGTNFTVQSQEYQNDSVQEVGDPIRAIPAYAPDIAIIGMAGRFPDARNVDEFWQNLQEGLEGISIFSEDELVAAGVDSTLLNNPRFVPVGAILDDIEWFDASFFGYSPREAEIIDPQQRIFLECAWQALEHAGYDAESYTGSIGVYAGMSMNTYLAANLQGNPTLAGAVDTYQLVMGNGPDFLTTRVSYKLNLRGPSVTVQTACSTSLVAVHMACESLRTRTCDMALAGGVSVRLPQKAGYLYQEGGIMSPDGHCRAFDAKAQGIVGGEGIGIVVLKRLDDALADGDTIHAIIKGSAMNNDGSMKVGYTAPSIQGQAEVIANALMVAGVAPETVSYIEAHGTGTPIGDPIEIAALRQAYRTNGTIGRCALGSVKTNIGHLDAAAGVAGLLKTVLALKHRLLPPSLHFDTLNPALALENSSFYINAILTPWERNGTPRRAGVSSFGIGGTNAHVVLEEAPESDMANDNEPARPWQVITLSAKTESALKQARVNLADYLRQHPDLALADVAYTLQLGRRAFKHRQMIVCKDVADAVQGLDATDVSRLLHGALETSEQRVAFLFPGQGSQFVRMGQDLYQRELIFRAEVDHCIEILTPYLGVDLRSILYPTEEQAQDASLQLNQTWLTQPALFVIEYALARLWMAWGVQPVALIGHSVGEYVAACLSGVFSLDDALKLVAARGRLMQQLPCGSMLAVSLSEEDVLPFLGEQLSLAAVNSPNQCVVSGLTEAIENLARQLLARNINCQRLHTSHAFHSAMMEPMLEAFAAEVASIQLCSPQLSYISNVTGTWITAAQVTEPHYWVHQLRQTVRFADGIQELLRQPNIAMLEVGPGIVLSSLVKQQARTHVSVPSLRRVTGEQSESEFILTSLGRLWLAGVAVKWSGLYTHERRRRIPLPTYPFERQRYWIERVNSYSMLSHHAGNYALDEQKNEALPQDEAQQQVTSSSLHMRPNLPVAYMAARNDAEHVVVAIWQQLMGIDGIGIYDNFFDLGGHSLLATQIVARLQAAFGVEIPLRKLLELPTIADLTEHIESFRHATTVQQLSRITSVVRDGNLPLSFAQQRIWLFDQLRPGNPLYNIPIAARICGVLNQAILAKSLQAIVSRHEALRTTFSIVDGRPIQVIAPTLDIPMPVKDLQHLPVDEREDAMLRLAHDEALQSFDLASGPLLRTVLFCLAEHEHVLMLTTHHIISDGWSMGVFFRELTTLYSAFVADQPSPLQELPVQYVDFAAWQRHWLQGETLEEQLTYWKKQLGGDLPVLELPIDYPRPPVQTYSGAHLSVPLPTTLMEDLKQLSQRENVTMFMIVLAAFLVLLSRYTRQEDITVGTPIAGRKRADVEDLIGDFVGSLILRTDLSGNPTFQELLSRVKEVTLEAYAHQDLPFDQLVEALQPQRDMSRPPLFQVILRMPNVPVAPFVLNNLTFDIIPIKMPMTYQELALDLIETANGFITEVEYNTDLFEASTIKRLLGHWQTILEAIVVNPRQRLAEVPILTPIERQQILSVWNSVGEDNYIPRLVCEVFEAKVAQAPESIAVVFEDEQVTYAELNSRANQLAHHLHGLGVGPEVPVGVCVDRSIAMVIALLGILKAGGAYVPLDPNYPEDRLTFMMEDAGLHLLLSTEHIKMHVSSWTSCPILCLDTDWPSIACHDRHNLQHRAGADNLAYIIYTSGSTGRPKGVLVSHRGLYNLVEEQRRFFDIQATEHALHFASISFDASVAEIFTPLCTGVTLYLGTAESLMPGPDLVALVRRHQISLATLPPSTLAVLPVDELDSVHTIVVAGDTCSAEIVQRWAKERRFLNGYGPTEATVAATIGVCDANSSRRPAIGRPIGGVQVYLLDTDLQPVPIGIPGELHIGGVGLARGYLHRAELTAEKFIPHPFTHRGGERLYKTGDLARYLPDGTIEFVGRIDQQVKVRGFRIELGEIESALSRHPALHECAVIIREDLPGEKRLVAYVVAKQERPAVDELRAFLKERLPEYMVPGVFVFLSVLPLTSVGKIDRRMLPEPQSLESVTDNDYVAPRSPVEELLASAFAELLGLDRVSITGNFFELGGHSLLATQLISLLLTRLQINIPLQALFEAPSVAELAVQVEQILQSSQGLQVPPIMSIAREGDLPLSFAQQRLWFLDCLEGGAATYNIPLVMRIKGELKRDALQRSLQTIVQRHESLRTIIRVTEEDSTQFILPTMEGDLPFIDLCTLPDQLREEETLRIIQQESLGIFDLTKGPLWRARLLCLDDTTHFWLFTTHHIISDGWSHNVLARELTVCYNAYSVGKNPELPELPIQYADYALWQRQWLKGERLEQQLTYWRTQLADLALLELPTDHPRPPVQSYYGMQQTFLLSKELLAQLKDLSQREGVTLFMTLLAVFQVLLMHYSGQEDIAVGSPIANRTHTEIENLIGFFVNTLVMRTNLTGNPSWGEVLQRVKEVCLGAYTHQEVPFEQVVDVLQPVRDLSHSPLFQVEMAFQNDTPFEQLALHDLDIQPVPPASCIAKFDLTLEMQETSQGIAGRVEYRTDLFEAETIRRLIGHWQILLEKIVAQPEQRINDVLLLTSAEQAEMQQWNATRTVYEEPACLHCLIDAQVQRTPHAVAVVFEEQNLTYQELDQQANLLAQQLRRQGVGPDVPVGVFMERSLEMVIALLAVLKAGGAYVPLDPSYPAERLAFMLTDAQVPLLLTQQHLATRLPDYDGNVLYLYPQPLEQNLSSESNGECAIHPQNLAYIIYTSGSTGKPKGAMNTHVGICNRLLWMRQMYQLGPQDRMLQKTPFGFDDSVCEFFCTLLSGACLVIARPEGHRDPFYLAETIATYQITFLHFVPSMLREFLSIEASEQCRSVRQIICSGEALPIEVSDLCQQQLGARLDNLYGPSEVAVDVTYWPCQYSNQYRRTLIGWPIANIRIYLLNAYMQQVPVGVPGELYIGGIGVARGYWRRTELTAERFVPDPFGEPGDRLYRTGDLARYLPDGSIEYLRRLDTQVKIRGNRVELGEIESALERHPSVKASVAVVREETPGDLRLVAYVVLVDGAPFARDEIRSALSKVLPEYMIPAQFVVLETLPLTNSGKVDRRALPPPPDEKREEGSFVAPRTPIEQALADIWEDILGVERVSIHDNFFSLGGDSILSIRIVVRASRVGLHLTVKQLFQYQTIAELSELATIDKSTQAEQGLVRGSAQLTPIQRWFFSQPQSDPHHFNQFMYLDVLTPLDNTLLRQALESLLLQHDALRLHFTEHENNWRQTCGEPDGMVSFVQVNLAECPLVEQEQVMRQTEKEVQLALNISQGPLLRVVYFCFDGQRNDILLMSIHHLVVDNVSWQILLEDLQSAYQQLKQGKTVLLPPKTSSYLQWAEHIIAYSHNKQLLQEQAYWLAGPWERVQPLPLDDTNGLEQNTVATQNTVSTTLSASETKILLGQVPVAYQAEILEVLLAALAQVLSAWAGTTTFLTNIERHGREDIFEDVNVSRTVGWFTSLFPLCVDLAGAVTQSNIIQIIQERLRQVPHRGVGYGILRYISEVRDTIEALRTLPQAEVLFNYLGQVDRLMDTSDMFRWGEQDAGLSQNPQKRRAHVFEINCAVRDGRFQVFWSYSESLHGRMTIEQLATAFIEALRSLIAGCQTIKAGGYISAEFPALHLNAEELGRVLAEVGVREQAEIESIAPLSPVQLGMFYETMSHLEAEMYVEQLICTFTGNLNRAALEQAWQWIVSRHSIFRTAFSWETYAEPLQIVLKSALVPSVYYDWRHLSPSEQAQALDHHLAAERKACVSLVHPPVMRIAIFQMKNDSYEFAWTVHHLLVDGWSSPTVIREVMTCYQALCQGQRLELEGSRPYRDYVAWLMQQNNAVTEHFWRANLKGFQHATPLGKEVYSTDETVPEEHYGSLQLHLPEAVTAQLRSVARQRHLTLNTLLQGTWAVLLSRYSESHDVLFGITVSGRPAEIEGIDTMVGPCINTIPLRLQIPFKETAHVWSWLEQVQTRNLELQPYEHTPGGTIHQWSDVPDGQPLYESLLVVENFPADLSLLEDGSLNMQVSHVRFVGAKTRYALTLLITPRNELEMNATYDTSRLKREEVENILCHFMRVLEYLADDKGEIVVQRLYTLIPPEQVPHVLVRRRNQEDRYVTAAVPRNELEALLLIIWQEVLGLTTVGIHDNFFSLGGHSLLATQLVSRVATTLQVKLALRSIFEAPTVALLAERVAIAQQGVNYERAVPPIVQVPRNRELPLSFAQQRLWFLSQLMPGNISYNIPMRMRLSGALDVEVLKRSLNEIVSRHEALRTTFTSIEGRAVQVISPLLSLALPIIDLRRFDTVEREAEILRLVVEESQQTFDLGKGPLIRATLLWLGDEEYILLVTVHHIVFDAWSGGVLSRELMTLYDSYASGKPSPLPELPIQYADFAVWQREWLQGEVMDGLIDYWRGQLQGAAPLELPVDHPQITTHSAHGAVQSFLLPSELFEPLKMLSQQEGTTLFMTMLAAFQVLLYRYSGQEDIVVGTDIANRARMETEMLIGFFVNLLALRTDLSGLPSFREVLRRVREIVLGAYAHQDAPFEKIVDALQLERKSNQIPLIRALFVFQNIPMPTFEMQGVTLNPVDIAAGTTNFDLAFFLEEGPQGITGMLNYSTDLFDSTTIIRILEHFKVLLANLVAQPDAPVNTVEMYTAAEKADREKQEMARYEKQRRKLKIAQRDEVDVSEASR